MGFTNSGGTWGKCGMCLRFGCVGLGGVGGEWVGGLCQGMGDGMVLCLCVVNLDSLC